ncbi:DUF1284 domain-containing protein [Candidatus Woesearchaeota archaeon]|jgi:hypothetical protein|nr:DUF1284 domain-containing protein [Candidatus Woesearchaeota archaeon]
MKTQPVRLRGHHLSRIDGFDMSREDYGKLMVKTGYSEDPEDSFATATYDFLHGLKQHPQQKVLVTAGEPDFICQRCPESKKAQCVDHNPKANPLYNTVFWDESMSPKNRDEELANKEGLEIGRVYSVDEIIKATAEQTRDFKSSLEDC